jgi:hypothetical protein
MPNDTIKRKMASQLMERSNKLKQAAAQQEALGKAQIKNKVKQGQTGTSLYKETLGQPYPVGKERLDIASKMRREAKRDSLASVGLSKPKPEVLKPKMVDKPKYATPEEKLKIAKQLYKDNPGKVYADAVKRAEQELIRMKKK